MEELSNTSKRKYKKPLYVSVYETIVDRINKEEYPLGQQLPGENALALELGVSRGTLRQALLILQEDGIIYNIKGKGNFVANHKKHIEYGLERIINIPQSFCKKEITHIEVEITLEVVNSKIKDMLDLKDGSIIVVCHRVYKCNKEAIGYGFSCIPQHVITEHEINLNDNDAILIFAEETLLSEATTCHESMKYSFAGEFMAEKLGIPEESGLLVIEDILIDTVGIPTAYTRMNLKPEYFEFHITRKNM